MANLKRLLSPLAGMILIVWTCSSVQAQSDASSRLPDVVAFNPGELDLYAYGIGYGESYLGGFKVAMKSGLHFQQTGKETIEADMKKYLDSQSVSYQEKLGRFEQMNRGERWNEIFGTALREGLAEGFKPGSTDGLAQLNQIWQTKNGSNDSSLEAAEMTEMVKVKTKAAIFKRSTLKNVSRAQAVKVIDALPMSHVN